MGAILEFDLTLAWFNHCACFPGVMRRGWFRARRREDVARGIVFLFYILLQDRPWCPLPSSRLDLSLDDEPDQMGQFQGRLHPSQPGPGSSTSKLAIIE